MIVLVTGASGGLGSVLGATLVSEGMTVYGTMRHPEGQEHRYPFTVLPMEATDPNSVKRCVDEVVDREGRIDVLVNCFNQMIIGSFEEQSEEDVRSTFDTNVLGVLRVCQHVLPVMRAQGSGTIINMSSAGGLFGIPYMSTYTSTKCALEAMTEALYHEMRPHGIDVVIMQPVAMAMDRPGTGAHLRMVDGVTSDSPSRRVLSRMEQDTASSKLTPEAVARKILQVIRSDKKPLRVPMDKAKALTWVSRLAPQPLIDRLIDRFVG